MVKLEKESNLKSKRVNSDISNSSSFPSFDKEIEIQVNLYQDRQYSSNVQYHQKIGSNEFVPYVAEDLEIIRDKLLAIKSNTHSSNRQIKQTRDEQKLSSERRRISNDSVDFRK
jgi:hypothetical protein